MKPDWDKLGETYKHSSSVVIADVDCTSSDAESVCTDNDVSGYPTIKYFTAETGKKGQDYSGGRDFDSLDGFVKETLAKKCNAHTMEDCDEKEKAYIGKWKPKSAAALKAEAARLDSMKDGHMTDDKKAWINKRVIILKDLAGGLDQAEEL